MISCEIHHKARQTRVFKYYSNDYQWATSDYGSDICRRLRRIGCQDSSPREYQICEGGDFTKETSAYGCVSHTSKCCAFAWLDKRDVHSSLWLRIFQVPCRNGWHISAKRLFIEEESLINYISRRTSIISTITAHMSIGTVNMAV